MASSDDEELKLALALSMQQNAPQAADNAAIDLTSDTEDEHEDNDEDMKRAIALSLQESVLAKNSDTHEKNPSPAPSTNSAHVKIEKPKPPNPTALPSQASSGPTSIFGIDRKAMEAERLVRLGKRKRDASPERPSKQIAKATPSGSTQLASVKSSSSPNTTLQYHKGTIKRTFATKYPRTDDITIDEVLQADSVQTAVISSFMWDSEWMWKKLNPVKVKQIWIMNAKDRDTQERYRREMTETGVPNFKIYFPPMGGMIHSMHSKYMLLFGNDNLRIVVMTANMTPIDWGEVKNDWQPGVMENSVFLVDLPRRVDGVVGAKDGLTAFGTELIYFLEKQEVDRKVIEGVLKFDFSKTAHLAFVHSIGGSHKPDSPHATGLPALTQAIRSLHLDSVKAIELDYAASSLGGINDTFLTRIYLAAQGLPFTSTSTPPSDVRKHIRIYFPTHTTVQNSHGGPDCGGIITLSRQHYTAPTFPRECLRNYDSTRRGMLSHNKLLFARGVKTDGKVFAWVYVGSANVSESAWGAQKVLKSGELGSVNVRNWECGVVVPVAEEKIDDGKREVPPMSVFGGTVEVPFVVPGEEYGDDEPWFFRP